MASQYRPSSPVLGLTSAGLCNPASYLPLPEKQVPFSCLCWRARLSTGISVFPAIMVQYALLSMLSMLLSSIRAQTPLHHCRGWCSGWRRDPGRTVINVYFACNAFLGRCDGISVALLPPVPSACLQAPPGLSGLPQGLAVYYSGCIDVSCSCSPFS